MRSIPLLTAVAAIGAMTAATAMAQLDLIKVGAQLAAKGAGDAVPACETCHGEGLGEFPLLSGDAAFYIVKQLNDFRSGKRVDDTMTPIAKALSTTQIEGVALHYEAQARKKAEAPPADAALVAKGRILAVEGDSGRDIFPCDRCHGERGMGGDFVGLAGQNPEYVFKQITDLRAGKRSNDELGIMQAIAKKLTDEDVRAAAAYYNQVDRSPLPPPPPPKK